MSLSILHTPSLYLRHFQLEDALNVQRLANNYNIAKNLATLPHPYLDGMAESWIESHESLRKAGTHHIWAITLNKKEGDKEFIGAIGLHDISAEHAAAELGYWLAEPHWGKGFASEAVPAVVRVGFQELPLERIFATPFVQNPASGRILQKSGFLKEGVLRRGFKRFDEFQDLIMYAALRDEWLALGL